MSRKQKIALGSAYLLIVLLLVMIVGGRNGFFDYRRLNQEKNALAEKNREIETENLALYESIKRLKHDPKYVENVARRELGMVGRNELIFKFKKDIQNDE